MSIFQSKLRANDPRRVNIGNESVDNEVSTATGSGQSHAAPAGQSNVTGVDTPPAGLNDNETPGLDVPGENSDVQALVEAEACAEGVEQAARDLAHSEEVSAVAMESLSNTMHAQLRGAFALESIAEQLDETLVDGGEGITPQVAKLIITGNDALSGSIDVVTKDPDADIDPAVQGADPADQGEVFGAGVAALESFAFAGRIATESLSDEAEAKSTGLFSTVANAVKSVASAVSKRLQGFADFFKDSHTAMGKFLGESNKLKAASGQKIDADATSRMRKHIAMTGAGTAATVTALTKDLPLFVDAADDVFEMAAKLSQSLDPSDPSSVSREAQKFFTAVQRKLTMSGAAVKVEVTIPTSFELNDLAQLRAKSFAIDYKWLTETGSQEYVVLSEQELQKMVRASRDIGQRMNALYQNGITKFGDGFFSRLKKQKQASAENAEQMKLARKAYANVMVVANEMVAATTYALIGYGYAIGHHALMLTRSSFQEAAALAKAAGKEAGAK